MCFHGAFVRESRKTQAWSGDDRFAEGGERNRIRECGGMGCDSGV